MKPLLFVLAVSLLGAVAGAQPSLTAAKIGHSPHGEAFDSGPREKPWVMEGIGHAHFPITTQNPEVQKWFDQGITLLHSFWYFEAERAFRWCLKLEPENAMAFWGLAMAVADETRSQSMIREAVKHKDKAGERERLYIDALAARLLADPLDDNGSDRGNRERKYKKLLETICIRYPDDVEAKAQLALDTMGDSRLGAEMIVRQILAAAPDHPGAHHYRIHNWNYNEPEQALDSCERYGKIAPEIGHAQHMPGHIYAMVGMWNEAAISMDAATRVEKRYMKQRMIFPFNNWNYAHNRNYLAYIQGQLGMAEAAIQGGRDLIAAPRDPKYNNDSPRLTHSQGQWALLRDLIKFERWKDLLDPKTFEWGDSFREKMHKAFAEGIANLALGNIDQAEKRIAEHAALKKDIEKNKDQENMYRVESLELKARLALARGDALAGLAALTEAAQREAGMQKEFSDPPFYPESLYVAVGRAYLDQKSAALAVRAYEKALELTRNDGFALAGLVEAYAAIGDRDKAKDAMARLLYVWSDADRGLKPLERAKATGITAEPRDSSPRRQRNYLRTSLEHFGPNRWEPYEAPKLDAVDSGGKRVTLEEYRGKNVLLVFYLGEECPHCIEQLQAIAKSKDELIAAETVMLAISSAPPAKNAASERMGKLPFRLLSETHFENARRFKSYDDFEDIELHSTILIDRLGRVHWARSGGDPFTDVAFLTKELARMNAAVKTQAAGGGGR